MSYVVADCDLARARTQACSIREKKACCSIILCSIGVLELNFVIRSSTGVVLCSTGVVLE